MSNTDLYGKPLTPKPEFRLNTWQKRQAALLYHFASLDYLKGLKKLLDDFVKGVDITLDRAKQEGRDRFLVSERWGSRDTSANFSTYGFAALMDFQKSVSRQIAEISIEYYHGTGFNQCNRLLQELSLNWTTEEEEAQFEGGMKVLGQYAACIDGVMNHRWTDDLIHVYLQEHGHLIPRRPKFKVRTDVEAESGRLPIRTGVYVPQDDPYGTLQFAWTGNVDGRLADCQTFNELGLQAVKTVGRDAIWTPDPRLLPLLKHPAHLAGFKEFNWTNNPNHLDDARSAWLYISANGFTTRPCTWYYVERVEGEFDDEEEAEERTPHHQRQRCEASLPCPREGYWFTPARANSRRHFKAGELMPEVGGDYGATIWQWDSGQ
ncbi:MAG: hypothetical protein KF891_02345 [Rhizobacter sp.]|nr:hypothetical protein [Rhizobacter sp.]